MLPEIRSLKDLAIHLNRGGEYLRYDLWSRSVHPDLLATHTIKPPDDDQQRVRKLRDGDRITTTIFAALQSLKEANEIALGFARPEEIPSFQREWTSEVDRMLEEIGEEVTIWNSEDL